MLNWNDQATGARFPEFARRGFLKMAAATLIVACEPRRQADVAEAGNRAAAVPGELVPIPTGEFAMGSDSQGDEGPAHKVRITSFYMDRYEVTNARYLEFCEATGHPLPEFWGMKKFRCGPGHPDHPVVGVSWRDAVAYATWRGGRLPTEAEWEYAARGGLEGMDYPGGAALSPSDGNYSKSSHGGTVAVGTYRPNGFGLHDMQGNVSEWVNDFYDPEYYASSPLENPRGPESGKFKVIRGGGWHTGPGCSKVHFRNALVPGWVDFNVGFRCAKDLEPTRHL